MRVILSGKSQGVATIKISNIVFTLNDGKGTLIQVPDVEKTINVTSDMSPSIYVSSDVTPPSLTAEVVNDKDLFNGQSVLIFKATDKESGVDHVELKEGNDPWVTVESPYLLHSQSKRLLLTLRAFDSNNNMVELSITPPASTTSPYIWIVILILVIIFYVFYKKIFKSK